jgi:hypothetical protein
VHTHKRLEVEPAYKVKLKFSDAYLLYSANNTTKVQIGAVVTSEITL